MVILIETDGGEDDFTQRTMESALGATCLVAHSGQQAISLARDSEVRDRVRLVLVTMDPAAENGFDVLRELADCASLSGVPLVCLGDMPGPSELRTAYELGARSYLVKPSDQAVCQEMLALAARFWLRINMTAHDEDSQTLVR